MEPMLEQYSPGIKKIGKHMQTTSTGAGSPSIRVNTWHWGALILLRLLIGWHFLYEGIVKILNPNWSSASYLVESEWFLADFFKDIVANSAILTIVDFLNQWGLVAVGLGLILGLFTRFATICGMALLALYYLGNPPLVGMSYSMPAEGSYLIVNKNLIELAALLVLLMFPTGKVLGLDLLLTQRKQK